MVVNKHLLTYLLTYLRMHLVLLLTDLEYFYFKNVHAFCPTRWTVRGTTLAAIVANHSDLMSLWRDSLTITKETEMKGRLIGAQSCMSKFPFLFGCLLGEKVLMQTDNLSRSLQSPSYQLLKHTNWPRQ